MDGRKPSSHTLQVVVDVETQSDTVVDISGGCIGDIDYRVACFPFYNRQDDNETLR